MLHSKFIRSIAIGMVAALAGACGKQDLYFATSSSVGVEVSGDAVQPVQANFGFQRREVARVPTNAAGEAFPVYGNIDVDMQWFGERMVHQIFATGEAAGHAAERDVDKRREGRGVPECVGSHCKPLVFASHSSVGIHASTGTAPQPASFSLGYKRVEATWIPTDSGATQTRSVFGDIAVTTCGLTECGANDPDVPKVKRSATGGVRLTQTIATGSAAITVAQREETKAAFAAAVEGAPPPPGNGAPWARSDGREPGVEAKHVVSPAPLDQGEDRGN